MALLLVETRGLYSEPSLGPVLAPRLAAMSAWLMGGRWEGLLDGSWEMSMAKL